MTNTKYIFIELQHKLQQTANNSLSCKDLVNWVDDQHWELIEGSLKYDYSQLADFLREILDDINAQWECLIANIPDDHPQFPAQFIQDWLSDLLSQKINFSIKYKYDSNKNYAGMINY